MSKFIFVTGGVASSVGKGISVASLGRLLKNRGVSVSLMKLDPYINVDPGTMSPYQHGEVFVTAKGMPEYVEVAVRDTGIGIKPEDQQHIFERFFRAKDGSEKDKIEGTGLGLSIVKSLVEKHGGQVWLESKPGVGSTFAFTLPRTPQLSEGQEGEREAVTSLVEGAESHDFVREDNSNEELDAVDDNLQEPPQSFVDSDESGALA